MSEETIELDIEALILLKEYGAEWPAGVAGTGHDGLITKEDVELYLGLKTK